MDIFKTLKISSSALAAQRTRLNTISSNIANIETTRTPEGGPYRKQEVVFQTTNESFDKQLGRAVGTALKGVEVSKIQQSTAPPKMVYRPEHPDADEQGMVAMPDINVLEEIVDMTTANKAYEANVTVIKSAKRMALKALEIGK